MKRPPSHCWNCGQSYPPHRRYKGLRENYERLTIRELADHYGVSFRAIHQEMVKQGIPRRRKGRANQRGSKNPAWVEGTRNYYTLHKRVRAIRGTPSVCEHCGTEDPKKKYEWASKTKKYEDPNDYIRLCKSCHNRFDEIINNLRGLPR